MTFDNITLGAWYAIQLRWLDDDTEEYWRECRDPGSDISDLPQEVQDQVNAIWTQEVIDAFNNRPTEPPDSLVPAPPKSMTPKQQRLLGEAREKMAEAGTEPAGVDALRDMVTKRLLQ